MKLIAALGAALCLSLPSLAGAQSYPSYAVAPQETIKGSITGFDGAYTVYVQDDRGYGDNVQMHDGTVINPTGIRLETGMRVTIYGYAHGPVFQAWRIDTPYQPYYPSSYYGGGYPGYYGGGYPGYYGGGYPYWGLGFGWWGGWGGYPYGYYRYPHGYYRGPYGGYYRGPYGGGYRGPYGGRPYGYHGTIQGSPHGSIQGSPHGGGHPPRR